MIITTLTGKNQTTIGMEFVKALGLKPGTKLMQTRVANGVLIEPIGDVMSAFGVFEPKPGFATMSIEEEEEAAELASIDRATKGTRDE